MVFEPLLVPVAFAVVLIGVGLYAAYRRIRRSGSERTARDVRGRRS
jgi:hypothetical protein